MQDGALRIRISIAMATYNGARYLPEQLDSLAKQTQPPFELVVCDDGSTDDTLRVLERFSGDVGFPVRVYRNEQNLGFADNFLKAARLCEGDWIAFCDQDDVWLPCKLADCADTVGSRRDLVLVLQNAELCDADLRRRQQTFPDSIRPGVYGPNRQFGFWVWPGFLMTFNSSLVRKLDSGERPRNYYPKRLLQSHDKWACMIANALGGIAVLNGAAALYRRHESTVTGTYHRKSLAEKVSGSLSTGADHYDFLAKVADSSVEYLEGAAAKVGKSEWRDRLLVSAAKFRRTREIMTERASLCRSASMRESARAFFRVLRLGGYFGDPFTAQGWRSAAKDLYLIGQRRK